MSPESAPVTRIVLRRATADDASKLAALAIQVWLDTYAIDGVSTAIADFLHEEFAPERFRALIGRSDHVAHVAEADSHLLGYAMVQEQAPYLASRTRTTALRTLYVQERFSAQGIGSALFNAAGAATPALKRALWVAVNTHNVRAINFYRKHGMVQIGTTFFELDAKRHENLVFAFASG
jgi:GNAT superfamily N-acetyltransferase